MTKIDFGRLTAGALLVLGFAASFVSAQPPAPTHAGDRHKAPVPKGARSVDPNDPAFRQQILVRQLSPLAGATAAAGGGSTGVAHAGGKGGGSGGVGGDIPVVPPIPARPRAGPRLPVRAAK